MLICAGKRVGATLLTHLLERGDTISQVIVSSAADTAIVEACRRAGIPCDIYYKGIAQSLAADSRRYEWLLNFWSPHLIPAEMLSLAQRRLNLHPSLVPHARGSDSTAWILRKRLPAGVSLIEMTEALDEGGVYAQRAIDLPFPLRGGNLHSLLQDEIILLFKQKWPEIQAGTLPPTPQMQGGTYHLRKHTNEDRVRDGASVASLDDTLRWILAHDFSPGTTAEAVIEGTRYRIRVDIEEVRPT